MKRKLFFSIMMLLAMAAFAQVPQQFTYQAVVRNGAGTLITNQNVAVRLSVVQGTEHGNTVYSETQNVRTNGNGLFTVVMGRGTSQLLNLDWAHGPYFLKSEVDVNGGSNYELSTVQQILSVPYAFRAHTVDTVIGGVNYTETDPLFSAWNRDYYSLTNLPNLGDSISAYLLANHVVDTIYVSSTGHEVVYHYDTVLNTEHHYDTVVNNVYSFDTIFHTDYQYDTTVTTVYSYDTVYSLKNTYDTIAQTFVIRDTIYTFNPSAVDTAYVMSAIANAGYLTIETDPTVPAWAKQPVKPAYDYSEILNTPAIPTVPTNVSAFANDANYLSTETDPTVPAWAKAAEKPVYDYSEITNPPAIPIVPGNISAYVNDVPYLSTETDPTVPVWAKAPVKPAYDYSEIANTPVIPTVPTNVSAFNNDAGYLTSTSIPTVPANISELNNDAGYITSYTESDPTVPAWAKAPAKPAYDYSEIANTPAIPVIPFNVSAFDNDANYLTTEADPTVPAWAKAATKPVYDYSEITGTPTIPTIPTQVSAFQNDVPYIVTEADPTVPAWAKTAEKPAYDYSEITGTPTIPTVPTNVSEFNNDAHYITSAAIPTNVSAFRNDAGYLTRITESDPTVPRWAKANEKPVYDYSEIVNAPVVPTVPTNVSAFENDANYITMDSIPTQVSAYQNDAGYITMAAVPTQVSAFENNAGYITMDSIPTQVSALQNDAGYITMGSVPTQVSAFANDALYITRDSIPMQISAYQNDAGFITMDSIPMDISRYNNDVPYLSSETDPNVPDWAKQPTKPAYSYNEINDLPTIPTVPTQVSAFQNDAGYITMDSIPTQISAFNNNAGYITAAAIPTQISAYENNVGYITIDSVPTQISAFENNVGYITMDAIPTRVSTFQNDANYISINSVPTRVSAFENDALYITMDSIPMQVSAYQNDAGYIVMDSIPTQVSAFANDALYITMDSIPMQISAYQNDALYITMDSIPMDISFYNNDVPFLSSESDPNVPDWAKAATKPSYDYSELSGTPTFATVAYSGSYGDLANTPDLSVYLTDESQTLADAATLGNSVNAQIKNLSNPTDNLDAVNKQYLENAITTAVNAAVQQVKHVYDSILAVRDQQIAALARRTNDMSEQLPSEGTGAGSFSISNSASVKFSQGNLQYQASTNTWRFAEHQYDCLGNDNTQRSASNTGWIDLFAWGTSGYHNDADNNNANYNPWASSSTTVSNSYNKYGYGPSTNMTDPDLTGTSSSYDWGVFNAISNGGDQAGMWRTLTKAEWQYLLDTRTASTVGGTENARFCQAIVNGIDGYILFPDEYTHPESVPAPQFINVASDFHNNTYSADQWAQMEGAGCVLLPATGYYNGSSVSAQTQTGYYWTSTHSGADKATGVRVGGTTYDYYNTNRYSGYAVRLVKNNDASSRVSQLGVTTAEPTSILTTSAVSGGTVSSAGNAIVSDKGVCWSTSHNPTIADNHISAGPGSGAFTSNITGLTIGTLYYVRAYATNSAGTQYGTEYTFTTVPQGALMGQFSVSASKTVRFSQGNLQFTTTGSHNVATSGIATGTWRFAPNQYDYIGSNNQSISSSYMDYIDLFGWGTSGYHNSNDTYNQKYNPWESSTSMSDPTYNDYGYGPSTNMTDPDLTGTSANYDWGIYNAISNGSNKPGLWRTLTPAEWLYIINQRSASTVNGTANARYCKAVVNGTYCIILFPDAYVHPAEVDQPVNINTESASFSSNVISTTNWARMEEAGCVLIPGAGFRQGTSVSDAGSVGYYWTTSHNDAFYSTEFNIKSSAISNSTFGRQIGCSVRLVTNN